MAKVNVRHKVRAIYYDSDKGLFLIQTPKSMRDDTWTAPGGTIVHSRNRISELTRLIAEEVGLVPLNVAGQPFYGVNCPTKKGFIHTFAYDVELDVSSLSDTNLNYRFVLQSDLSGVNLTSTMINIVSSSQFNVLVQGKKMDALRAVEYAG